MEDERGPARPGTDSMVGEARRRRRQLAFRLLAAVPLSPAQPRHPKEQQQQQLLLTLSPPENNNAKTPPTRPTNPPSRLCLPLVERQAVGSRQLVVAVLSVVSAPDDAGAPWRRRRLAPSPSARLPRRLHRRRPRRHPARPPRLQLGGFQLHPVRDGVLRGAAGGGGDGDGGLCDGRLPAAAPGFQPRADPVPVRLPVRGGRGRRQRGGLWRRRRRRRRRRRGGARGRAPPRPEAVAPPLAHAGPPLPLDLEGRPEKGADQPLRALLLQNRLRRDRAAEARRAPGQARLVRDEEGRQREGGRL